MKIWDVSDTKWNRRCLRHGLKPLNFQLLLVQAWNENPTEQSIENRHTGRSENKWRVWRKCETKETLPGARDVSETVWNPSKLRTTEAQKQRKSEQMERKVQLKCMMEERDVSDPKWNWRCHVKMPPIRSEAHKFSAPVGGRLEWRPNGANQYKNRHTGRSENVWRKWWKYET